MANFRGHMTVSAALGAGYGVAGIYFLSFDWGPAFLGAGLTALGGLLPDLDSDSGILVRELFGLVGAAALILFFPRLQQTDLTPEQILVILTGIYLLVRYSSMAWFKGLTVHRGMFHSVPALLIAGLGVFLLHSSGNQAARLFLAGGVMVGFLSHLVLDELCSIDLRGATIRLNRASGSALKMASSSWAATAFTYLILLALAGLVWLDLDC